MDIVEYSLKKPVSVAVAVILLVTFGLIGLNQLPIQLTPDVETPKITVQSNSRRRWQRSPSSGL